MFQQIELGAARQTGSRGDPAASMTRLICYVILGRRGFCQLARHQVNLDWLQQASDPSLQVMSKPLEFDQTARALSLSVSPPRSPDSSNQNIQAPWTRRRTSQSNNRPFGRRGASFVDKSINSTERIWRQLYKTVERMSPAQRVLSILVGILCIIFSILFLIFSERIFAWLEPVAEKWKNLRGGWLILWAMTFATAFPPVIGYSTCLTLAGFVYGFPWG